MIALGTNLDQLDKVSGGLSTKIVFANARERILYQHFGQSMQSRFSTWHNRDFRLEKEIELTGKWSFRPACAFRYRLNAAQRFRAPGNDQTCVAKLSFAQKNGSGALHATNLAPYQRTGGS